MRTVTFTDFRRNASGLLSDVEHGESIIVLRHGKPIAEVSPMATTQSSPAWKQAALRLTSSGAGLAAAILGDRADEDIL